MRSGRRVVVGLCCALAGACTESVDGLLVDISVGGGIEPSAITHIEIWVGTPDPEGGANEFLRNQRDQDVRAVDAWPYRIHVLPGDEAMPVVVAAFGYLDVATAAAGDEPYALGVMPAPIVIEPGVLREAAVSLSRTYAATADCAFRSARDGLPAVVIRPRDATRPQLDCDNDGATEGGGDCDDLDAAVSSAAAEICDGRDNDCNGVCDDGLDADADGFSHCTYDGMCGGLAECRDESQLAVYPGGHCDCDDTEPQINPTGEVLPACYGANDGNCDGVPDHMPGDGEIPGNLADDDCDGTCDEDADGDLIAATVEPTALSAVWATTCEPAAPDCADQDAEIYPNALERCDDVDSDCGVVTQLVDGTCGVTAGGGCRLGRRTCADPVMADGWGACVAIDDGPELSTEVCAALAPHEEASWPELSFYDDAVQANGPRATCTLAAWRPSTVQGRVNDVCPVPRARIRNRLPWTFEQCETLLVAETGRIAGWQLELVPRDAAITTTGPKVPTCDVELAVIQVPGLGAPDVRLPTLWTAVIQQERGPDGTLGAAVVIPFEIRVHYAGADTAFACPPEPRALDCEEM